jgi:hypothetical protein
MSDASFETFFLASTGAGGAFIGLLFVALSIAPNATFGRGDASGAPRQQLAEATLVTLANGFVVSSFALIPGINVGWVAFAGGIWGVGAAAYIAWRFFQFHQHGTLHESWQHLIRVVTLSLVATLIYAVEATLGLALLFDETETGALRGLALTVTALYALAILRAWILLGDPEEGLSGLLNPLRDRSTDSQAAFLHEETPLSDQQPATSRP